MTLLAAIVGFLLLVKFGTCAPQPNPQRTPSGDYSVTHLDIRDAVLSLVRVLQDQMDKLERHEVRERQLGEQLTRSLNSLDKRGRGEEKNIENIAGFITKIDDKIKIIQTNTDKEAEERKLAGENNKNEFKSIKDLIAAISPGRLEQKLDGLTERVVYLTEVSIANNAKFNNLTELWRAATHSGSESNENFVEELREIKESLARAETKTPGNSEWQAELIESMDSQRSQLALLEEEITKAMKLLGDMTKSSSGLQTVLYELKNDTEKGFGSIRIHQLHPSGTGSSAGSNGNFDTSSIDEKITNVQEILTSGQQRLEGKLRDAEVAVGVLSSKMETGYTKLANEMKGLSNIESVLLDTGDSVLDTKRRLEYGVQQILGELGSQLKDHTANLNSSLQLRFDGLATSVLSNQSRALTNLTGRMEEEVSQVWRQIGILYHQMTRSANLLDEIHSQTNKYVNNSLDTMSSMDGKVGQITNRMGEVDDNLNYLLGRMSLVVQEFNMVKNGLGDALVQLKDDIGDIGGGGGGAGAGGEEKADNTADNSVNRKK